MTMTETELRLLILIYMKELYTEDILNLDELIQTLLDPCAINTLMSIKTKKQIKLDYIESRIKDLSISCLHYGERR